MKGIVLIVQGLNQPASSDLVVANGRSSTGCNHIDQRWNRRVDGHADVRLVVRCGGQTYPPSSRQTNHGVICVVLERRLDRLGTEVDSQLQNDRKIQAAGGALQRNLVGAYSYAAVSRNGNIDPVEVWNHRHTFLRSLASQQLSLVEKEARVIGKQFVEIETMCLRQPIPSDSLDVQQNRNSCWSNQRPIYLEVTNSGLWDGALIGVLASWRRCGLAVLGLVIASAILMGLTCSDHGRLFVPVRPLLHATIPIGVVFVVRYDLPWELPLTIR